MQLLQSVDDNRHLGIPLHSKMIREIRECIVVFFFKSYEADFKGEKTPKFPTLKLFFEKDLRRERRQIAGSSESGLISQGNNEKTTASAAETSSKSEIEGQMFTPTLEKVLKETEGNLSGGVGTTKHSKGVRRQIVFGTISEDDCSPKLRIKETLLMNQLKHLGHQQRKQNEKE